jgi:hypothetical protein
MAPYLRFIESLIFTSKAQKKIYAITIRFFVRRKLWVVTHFDFVPVEGSNRGEAPLTPIAEPARPSPS